MGDGSGHFLPDNWTFVLEVYESSIKMKKNTFFTYIMLSKYIFSVFLNGILFQFVSIKRINRFLILISHS